MTDWIAEPWAGPERRHHTHDGSADLARELGGMEARLRAVEEASRTQGIDIKAILRVLNEARGGWKTLVWVAGLSGLVGAIASKLMPFVPFR